MTNLDVLEDIVEDLLFGNAESDVIVVRMRAVVNDSIHVQVQIVELGNLEAFGERHSKK